MVAKPLRRGKKSGEAWSKARDGEVLPPADVDYAALAEKAMACIMAYGTEKGRMAAAKYFLDRDEAKRKVEGKGRTHVPVIQYVITGESPPLGEGEYDTSNVGEDGEDGEAELKRRFGVY
ncbi:hypothetical protein ABI_16830 [Asticcacaulis biprosthecium C19]|uniref:Uncharacterized protein n=1 Tax=Asticcacaulis biprosthecium C19 TaxID=715226 RepID=F4QK65_9CAUL|nr:hypothetical protein [Asticcacaulis biprosthecium]EGF93243.1 hypothetical protein ABI_16830 [Asticcacaulis biprosthecium C19]